MPDKLSLTPRSRKVIEYAIEESRNLGHCNLGIEHILLGLLRQKEGVASQVLEHLEVMLEPTRKKFLALLAKGSDSTASNDSSDSTN